MRCVFTWGRRTRFGLEGRRAPCGRCSSAVDIRSVIRMSGTAPKLFTTPDYDEWVALMDGGSVLWKQIQRENWVQGV
jgi:hypothetical protein